MSNQDRWAEFARRMKLERVRDFGDTGSDMVDLPGSTLVVRGGHVIAVIYGDGPNGARAGAYWAALMWAADEVISLSDTLARTVKVAGEMHQGDISRAWQAGQREGISEAILAVVVTRDGAIAHFFPYQRTGRQLRWLPPGGRTDDVEGAVVDYARDGFGKAKDATQGLEEAAREIHGPDEAPPAGLIERVVARMISQQEAIGAVVVLEPVHSYWEDGNERPHP